MEFVKINKTTSAQQVAEQLLGMIRRGAWKPGDRLPPERELIEKLDVGRSTVREALQILATLNIVQSSPGQGTFIKTPRGDEILRADLIGFLINDAVALELLEAREMIEPQTVRLACLRATDGELAAIDELLDRHETALKEGRSAADCAMLFHIMLAETSRSSVAATFLRSILELLNAQRQVENSAEFKYRELEEHRHILRLVQKRDAQAAADFLVRHIVDSVVIDVSYERWRDESKTKSRS
jgi:GntR family transcriptional repressor for pyruvate dehydrogenase complex